MLLRRLFLILLATPLAVSHADSVKLKSGEVIEGKVISSDATSVTIETQFSPTITDERTVARADIALLSVASDDEAAFTKIRDLKTPATALDARACTDILDNQLRPFLKKFPTSTRIADVKAMIKSFEADIDRLRNGEKKIAGEWYDADAYAAEKYQLEATVIFEAMQRDIAAKNYSAAMNDFGDLFDVVSVHWYVDGPDLEFFMDQLVQPASLGKPVWLAETGMKPCFSLFGEAGQALFYSRVLRAFAARQEWWTGVSFYDLHDDLTPGDCGSGITRPDWSNRAAFRVYQHVIGAVGAGGSGLAVFR